MTTRPNVKSQFVISYYDSLCTEKRIKIQYGPFYNKATEINPKQVSRSIYTHYTVYSLCDRSTFRVKTNVKQMAADKG